MSDFHMHLRMSERNGIRRSVAQCKRGVLILATCALGGCEHAGDRNQSVEVIQRHMYADTADMGRADLIGRVAAARLTSTGQAIIVLDDFPPYVRVLSADGGRLIRSFGNRGGGPGELSSPSAIAVLGDSIVAVAHRAGLSEFKITGEYLGTHPGRRAHVYGLSSYCDREWLVFGPVHAFGAQAPPDGNPWVQVLDRVSRLSDEPQPVTVLYRDSLVPNVISRPNSSPIAGTADRFGFVHLGVSPPRTHEGTCDSGTIRESNYQLEYAAPDRRELGPPQADGSRQMIVHVSPGPRHAGIGMLSGGLLIARMENTRSRATILTFLADSGPRELHLTGGFQLQDARPMVGALLTTDEPWPRVIVVPEPILIAAFSDPQ